MKVKAFLEHEDGTLQWLHTSEIPFERIDSTLDMWHLEPNLRVEDGPDNFTHVIITKDVWTVSNK